MLVRKNFNEFMRIKLGSKVVYDCLGITDVYQVSNHKLKMFENYKTIPPRRKLAAERGK